MREIVITAAAIAFVGVLIAEVVTRGRAVAELEAEVTRLERMVQQKQVMLDDAHRLYGVMERRVVTIETDMTARELLWHIEEIAAKSACLEVHK